MKPSCTSLFVAVAAVAACTPDTSPTWAYDPVWLEPAAQGAVHAFQTWQLYGPNWIDNSSERTYSCGVVVEWFGAPAQACDADPGCTVAWDLEDHAIVSSDCDEALLADPLFLSLQRVGLGGEDASPEAAWPGRTSIGHADYGNGWEVHGQAYAEALDLGATVEAEAWDGVQPFLMVPTKSFALDSSAP